MIESIKTNFDQFISQQQTSDNQELLNSSVLIIAVLGKEVADNTKADLLNDFLGERAFFEDEMNKNNFLNCVNNPENARLESSPLIDIHFDKEESIIWLIINGFNDIEFQHLLFNNINENFKNKSFFEKMSFVDREQLFALAQIFPLCHALLFIEQGCRFDLEWICLLKRLNKLRSSISRRIRSSLSSIPETVLSTNFPSSFVNTCRIGASPRLLFCFHRNPLRTDLNATKKKELLEKMEKCLETQIANLLKQHGLVDIKHPNTSFAQITISSGTPFVYCFNQLEIPVDVNNELAEALFGSLGLAGREDEVCSNKSGNLGNGNCINSEEILRLINQITEPSKMDRKELENSSDYNFPFFLHKAINKLRKDLTSNKLQNTPLPTLGQFIEAAKLLRRCIYDEKNGESFDLKVTISPEIESINSLVESAISSSRVIYNNQLSLQPKMTGGGDPVFSKIEHEYSLKMAVDHLRHSFPRSAGHHHIDKLISQLELECENTWKDGHQRCEKRSLTGQFCAYKEANFTFYNETGDDNFNFGSCCANLDKYKFKLFDVSTAQLESKNVDKLEEFVENVKLNESIKQKSYSDVISMQENVKRTITNPQSQSNNNEEVDITNEIGGGLAIDPSDFNVRFFDEGDDEESGEEIGEKINKIKLSQEEEKEKSKLNPSQTLLLGENEYDEDEDEPIRKKNVITSDEEVSEEEEEDFDEEEEEEREMNVEIEEQEQTSFHSNARSSTMGIPNDNEDVESSPEPPELHYLDEYDSHLTRTGTEQQNINIDNKRDVPPKETQSKLEKMDDSKLEENFKGQYLDHVPHTNSPPSLLPLFPSFSVVCIGHSSLYNHSTGIRGHDRTARFRSGSEYLLPWSVRLSVNTERWVREMQLIGANPTDQCLRNLQNGIAHGRTESNEKVKLFVGFDYECPRGHRFTCGEPFKPLKHRKDYGPLNQDAGPLLDADLPLWLTCPCRKPRIMAQLMRIHVVTPKAPVSMPDDDGYFFPGAMEGIELGWAKYYVCRLPYIYVGPNGRKSSYRPNSPLFKGRFLRQCISCTPLVCRLLDKSVDMMKTKNGPKVVYGTASVLVFTAVLCCAKVFLV
ncbi:unnamed protein product [Meloidogyne enterolobii]|uniref:Uncharacterized protein n=1 Tax=Meloidogyne enterolobii TaxID=390850 RepID=A0ACB0XKF4_MELEN